MVADIFAPLEIELEEVAHEPVLHVRAGRAGPADDAVRVERVGRHLDRVEGEVDALRLAERRDAGMGLAQPLLAAELAEHIGLAVDALRRDGRVELERPPAHGDIDIGRGGNRLVEPLLTEEAPRAHDIGHDVDRQGLPVGHVIDPSILCVPPGRQRQSLQRVFSGRSMRFQCAIHCSGLK